MIVTNVGDVGEIMEYNYCGQLTYFTLFIPL